MFSIGLYVFGWVALLVNSYLPVCGSFPAGESSRVELSRVEVSPVESRRVESSRVESS